MKPNGPQTAADDQAKPGECAHCGLPVPARLWNPDQPSFCCGGCETVYHAIRGSGLEDFYRIPGEGKGGQPAKTTGHDYGEFGDPDFIERYSHPLPDGLRSIELYLEGVHCASCVWLVERLPFVLDGVTHVRLHARRHVATVHWDPAVVSLPVVAQNLDRFGYPPHPYRGAEVDRLQRLADRKHLWRIGFSGAIAGNVMLLAFALYGGRFSGMAENYEFLIRFTSFALTLLAVFGPGRTFLRGAWSSIRARSLHMDVPVAVALLVGTAWGGWNTLAGRGEVYFESLTAVIFLLLIGRFVQHRQQRVASDAVELLFSLTPIRTRRWNGERFVDVPVSALQLGDRVQVLAGETLPADGVILTGQTSLDNSALSGESRPVRAGVGTEAFAGTTNLDAPIEVEVRNTGVDTRVGALMKMVEQGASERPPIVLAADRLAHWFVIAVLLLAAATLVLWLFLDPSRAVEQTVALLIVTCPCALGLATPLTFQAAIGKAARAGILIKSGEAVERLARPGELLLDKTGTLTEGKMRLVHWYGDPAAKGPARLLEQEVQHPIARAFVQGLADVDTGAATTDVQSHLGQGIEARVDGVRWAVGAVAWLLPEAASRAPWIAEALEQSLQGGSTPVAIAREGEVIAIAAIGDAVHPEASATLAGLRQLGWSPAILSGDHPVIVDRVARELGIDADHARGAVTPEGKLEAVREHRRSGPVVMVGDGVNDAAALSAADCGIAVHGGAEASLRASDVFLSRPGLTGLLPLFEGAQRTMRVVRRNFAASITYNLITASGAMMGWIHPLLAAALMPFSSLTVVTLAYRSKTFEAPGREPS
ncbi:MAG: heavy metal translocating P-type ATPase [Planctomycetota bacterium]